MLNVNVGSTNQLWSVISLEIFSGYWKPALAPPNSSLLIVIGLDIFFGDWKPTLELVVVCSVDR